MMPEPQKDKMMHSAPASKEYHFSGDGVYHNATIRAGTIEQATEQWHKTRTLIVVPGAEVAVVAKKGDINKGGN